MPSFRSIEFNQDKFNLLLLKTSYITHSFDNLKQIIKKIANHQNNLKISLDEELL
ncbi:hypothetical protein [Helicobacter valdiviensis]|uniref:hypothetical protein n=1 Tax=Helicobacter valdiviensis TaxID=1458358 RepID=UPI0015EBAD5F|nr:hypothetical protein [Helicobacter valdiviensis]